MLYNHCRIIKRHLIAFFLLFISICLYAQSNNLINEKGFSYQGYARDSGGKGIENATIQAKFTIYEEGNLGNPDFVESHTLQTDAFGVFSAVVGTENTAQFFTLDWAGKDYQLRAEVSVNSSDFAVVSDNQLLSVPYAQASGKAQNGLPPGSITAYAGVIDVNGAPDGYLLCDGSLVSTSVYPELFEAIGTSWGGNGTTEFRLPDLRGRFLRGVSGDSDIDPDKNNRESINGSNAGNEVGSYQDDQFRSHSHTMKDGGAHQHNIGFGNGTGGEGRAHESSDDLSGSIRTSNDGTHKHTIDNNGGSETRPVNANVHYLIKF